MKNNKITFIAFGVSLVLLSISGILTTYSLKDNYKRIQSLQQSNDELIQQNNVMIETLNEYEMNMKEYQSATDATIKEMMEDVEEIKLEKEVNESDLHKEEQTKEEIKGEYVGVYELTAYIATGNPCADGSYPQSHYTAACNDPSLWHKWVHIDGYGDYYICDRGGMANNVIDIFVDSYDEAIQFGRRSAGVSIIN